MGKFGLDTTELVFCIVIAILYVFFFHKLTNQASGYSDANSMCEKYPHSYLLKENDPEKEEAEKCRKEQEEKLKEIGFRRHVMLLFIALLGIIGSSFIQSGSTKLGVGMGGVLTLIVALCLYWSQYKETTKIAITGLSLLLVLFLSVRLYKINNITDIFALEFGTKTM